MPLFTKKTFFAFCFSIALVSCTVLTLPKSDVIKDDDPQSDSTYLNKYHDPNEELAAENESTTSAQDKYFVRPKSGESFSITAQSSAVSQEEGEEGEGADKGSDIWYILTNMSAEDINLSDYFDFSTLNQDVYPNIKTRFSKPRGDSGAGRTADFNTFDLSNISEEDKLYIINNLCKDKSECSFTTRDADDEEGSGDGITSPLGDYVGKKIDFCDTSRVSLGSVSTVRLKATCKLVKTVETIFGPRTLVIYEEDNLNRAYSPHASDYEIIADTFLKEGDDNDLYDKLTAAFGKDWGYYNATYLNKFGDTNSLKRPSDYLIDEDDTITILYCNLGNQGWENMGGVTMGYYTSLNYLKPQLKLSTDYKSALSNGRAMVTMHAYTSGRRFIGDGLTVLAHEFQHLIHDQYFNSSLWEYGNRYTKTEPNSAFQEIFSAAAETYTARFINKATGRNVPGPFYVGYGGNTTGYLSSYALSKLYVPFTSGRGGDYLSNVDKIAVDEWSNSDSNYGNYGIANAFANYILVNYGISPFEMYIQNPDMTYNSGLDGLAYAINSLYEGNKEGFVPVTPASLVADWSTTMLLSSVPYLKTPYCLNNYGWFIRNKMEIPSVNMHFYYNENKRASGFASLKSSKVIKSGTSAFIRVKSINAGETFTETAPTLPEGVILTCVALPKENMEVENPEYPELTDHYEDDPIEESLPASGESPEHPDESAKDKNNPGFDELDLSSVKAAALFDADCNEDASKYAYTFGSGENIQISLPKDGKKYNIWYMFTNTSGKNVSMPIESMTNFNMNIISPQMKFNFAQAKEESQKDAYLFFDILGSDTNYNAIQASPSSTSDYIDRKDFKATVKDDGTVVSPLGDYVGKQLMFYDGEYDVKATCKLVRPVKTAFGERTLVIYVEDGMFSLFGNLPTSEQYEKIADVFLKDGENNDIFDKLTTLFGKDWKYFNASYLAGELKDEEAKSKIISQDNTITLLYCNISVHQTNFSTRVRQGDGVIVDTLFGGVVAGYISEDNFYRKNYRPYSNERAMVTLHAHLAGGEYFASSLKTLAHEFQHLIRQQHMNRELQNYPALKGNIPDEGKNVSFDEIFSAAVENYIFDFINKELGSSNPGPFMVPYAGEDTGYLPNNLDESVYSQGRGPFLISGFDGCNLEKFDSGMGYYGMASGFGNYLMLNYGPKVFRAYYDGNTQFLDGMVNAINKIYQNANMTKSKLVSDYGKAVMLSCISGIKAPHSMNKKGWYNINGMRIPSVNVWQYKGGNYPGMLSKPDTSLTNNTNAPVFVKLTGKNDDMYTATAPQLPEGVSLTVFVLPADYNVE